jgi:ADP-heptose:LPS heptosyltransferase
LIKKLENILFINTGGGIGDALYSLPLINHINKCFSPKKIFYYSADEENFWFENKLSEYKPSNLITVKKFPFQYGFRKFHANVSSKLINLFDFDKFDLIIDNQTRLKNTLIYKKIPHKYYISPCLRYFFSKPFFFKKKNKNIILRLTDYLNTITNKNLMPDYNIEIPKAFAEKAEKLLPKNKEYIGFSITAGHPTRIKEFQLKEIIKLGNHYSKNFIPTFFIEEKFNDIKLKIKENIKDSYFPEEHLETNLKKPMIVTALGSMTKFNITIDNGISHMLSFSNNKNYIFYNNSSEKFLPLNENTIPFDCDKKNKKINLLTSDEILTFIESNQNIS